MKIVVKKLHEEGNKSENNTPEERLDLLEKLRLESGKFLYEYPAGFQRIIKVIRRK